MRSVTAGRSARRGSPRTAKRRLLPGLLDVAAAGIVVFDAGGFLVDCNETTLALLSAEREIIGAPLSALHAGQSPHLRYAVTASCESAAVLQTVMVEGGRLTVDYAVQCQPPRTLEAVFAPAKRGYVLCTLCDVTGSNSSADQALVAAERVTHERVLALAGGAQALATTLEPAEVLHEIAAQARLLAGAAFVLVMVEHGDVYHTEAVAGDDHGYGTSLRISADAASPLGQGASGRALRSGLPVTTRDVTADPSMEPWQAELAARGIRSSAALPLMARGNAIGVLNLYAHSADAFDAEMLGLLGAFAAQAALTLDNARLYNEMRDQALTDPLTGLPNRRAMERALAQVMAHGARTAEPLSLLALDLDDFKVVNDTYGHIVGDQLLRAVAHELLLHVRGADVVARQGGEEFFVLLAGTPAEGAHVVAEALRKAVAATFVPAAGSASVGCTVSVGVAVYQPGWRLADFQDAADAAMYRAKRAGKNRVGD